MSENHNTLIGWIGAAVAVLAGILGIGRFVGSIETRIETLERQQKFLHGTIDVRGVEP